MRRAAHGRAAVPVRAIGAAAARHRAVPRADEQAAEIARRRRAALAPRVVARADGLTSNGLAARPAQAVGRRGARPRASFGAPYRERAAHERGGAFAIGSAQVELGLASTSRARGRRGARSAAWAGRRADRAAFSRGRACAATARAASELALRDRVADVALGAVELGVDAVLLAFAFEAVRVEAIAVALAIACACASGGGGDDRAQEGCDRGEEARAHGRRKYHRARAALKKRASRYRQRPGGGAQRGGHARSESGRARSDLEQASSGSGERIRIC